MRKLISPAVAEFWFWLALCGGLAVAVGIESDWGRAVRLEAAPHPAATADFMPPELAPAFKIAPADDFIDIALRPIFVATRSPVPPAVVQIEPPKPRMKKGQFLLTGTMISPDGRFAQLAEKTGGKVRIVAEGDEISGMLVWEIGPTHVVLKLDEDSERITLRAAKAPTLPKGAADVAPTNGAAATTAPTAQRPARRTGQPQPTLAQPSASAEDNVVEGNPKK